MADIAILDQNQLPEADILTTSKWLPRVRAIWLGMIALLFVVFVFSIPGTYKLLTTVCDPAVNECLEWSQPTPETIRVLNQYHISLESIAIYHLTLYVLVSLVFWGSGLLVLRHRSYDWYGLLVSHLLIALGAGGVSLVFLSGASYSGIPDVLQIITGLAIMPLYLSISLFFLTFPDGRIYPRWTRFVVLLIILNYGVWLAPGSLNIQNWSLMLSVLWILFVFGSHVAVQGLRYRNYYTPEQRQQTKWLIYGFTLVFSFGLFVGFVSGEDLSEVFEGTFVSVGYLPIAVAVTIAILRYRLWDIDIIINRTLVYTVLTALVIGVYVLIVGGLGELFQQNGNFLISLTATGVVAIMFQPLRARLQTGVDHYIFGERNNPYAVISRLSERLEENVAPNTLLPGIAAIIAQALKLPYVSIALQNDGGLRTEAVIGQPADRGRITTLPLLYGQATIGQMVIGQAPGDKVLVGTERDLLENIARQAGIAAHAVQLSTALQQSRQQIITAREEERRRLRRDLHDGLGPTLAAHTLKVGTARALIESDPQTATSILDDLESSLTVSLADIRRLVYNLRPPALDQLGFVGALRDFVDQYNLPARDADHHLALTLDVPENFAPLPAAVEVAIFRIVQEAVNNVVRHAYAQHCNIVIGINGNLTLTVTDDGVGIRDHVKHGVGLNSMSERAEELGGTCLIESVPQEGTQICVTIPLR